VDFTLGQDTVLLADTAREIFERDGVLRDAVEGSGSGEPVRSRRKLVVDAGLNLVLVPEPLGVGCELLDATVVLEQSGRNLLSDPLAEIMVLAEILTGLPTQHLEIADAILAGQVDVPADLLTLPSVSTVSVETCIRVPWVGDPERFALLAGVSGSDDGALIFFDSNGPGVRLGELDKTDPSRPTRVVTLDGAVPVESATLSREVVVQARQRTAILRAAELVGSAAAALEQTLQYVRERRQFRREIGSYQAVKHSLADIYASVEQARAVVQMAAITAGARVPGSERDADAAARWVAAAVMTSAGAAIHLHGGMGFAWETGLHLHLRRALALRRIVDASAGDGTAPSLHTDSLEATV
jgi:hypothetical protein